MTHIPPGLAGLFTDGLLGSAMAMHASDMSCLSVIGVEDFYAWTRPRSNDRKLLRMGRIIVAVSGLAAAGVALRLAHSQGGALSRGHLPHDYGCLECSSPAEEQPRELTLADIESLYEECFAAV